jgi:hypothetical protein
MSSGSVLSSIAGHQPTSKETVPSPQSSIPTSVTPRKRGAWGSAGAGRFGGVRPSRAGLTSTVRGVSTQRRPWWPRCTHTTTCQRPPARGLSAGRARTRRGRSPRTAMRRLAIMPSPRS